MFVTDSCLIFIWELNEKRAEKIKTKINKKIKKETQSKGAYMIDPPHSPVWMPSSRAMRRREIFPLFFAIAIILITQFANLLFGISSIWLFGYGLMRIRFIFKSNSAIEIDTSVPKGIVPTISILTVVTFANPHVYLDTMVLIGSISQQFSGNLKVAYAIGASLASFVFFFSLAYGAKSLLPIMQNPNSWRILDLFIALIMFTLAFKLAFLGNWL